MISTVMVVQGQVMDEINHDGNEIGDGDGDGRLWSSVCCTEHRFKIADRFKMGVAVLFLQQASRSLAS